MLVSRRRREIADILAPFHVGDEKLGVLLALSVGRLMLRTSNEQTNSQSKFSEERIRHIADWLKSALVNEARWLKNVDDLGRPKKLLKYGTLDGILAEVDRSMLIEAQKLSNVRIEEGDEELYAELDDGMYLVKLLTPVALDRESHVMQHCIGNGRYDYALDDPHYMFLSLRDRHGNAHATLEIDFKQVKQIQGKQNRIPIKKYLDSLAPFIKKNRYQVKMSQKYFGHVIDSNGNWHPLNNLPNNLNVKDDLFLDGPEFVSLPKGLKVGGNLSIYRTKITSLPDGLKVGGTLDIVNTEIVSLPVGLRVERSLYLNDKITLLPENLDVGGSLVISGTNIRSLPKGLIVGDTLMLRCSEVVNLPDDIRVFGHLNISDTKITSIPEGVKARWISIRSSNISTLPDSILDTTTIECDDGIMSAKMFRNRSEAKVEPSFRERLSQGLRRMICAS